MAGQGFDRANRTRSGKVSPPAAELTGIPRSGKILNIHLRVFRGNEMPNDLTQLSDDLLLAQSGPSRNGEFPGITRTPGICGGDPCINGTRYTVWGLYRSRQLGAPDEELLKQHPDLSQHDIVWRLLDAERAIGTTLTEAFQIIPEQSTAALIVHHPQATYFNAAAVRELAPA